MSLLSSTGFRSKNGRGPECVIREPRISWVKSSKKHPIPVHSFRGPQPPDRALGRSSLSPMEPPVEIRILFYIFPEREIIAIERTPSPRYPGFNRLLRLHSGNHLFEEIELKQTSSPVTLSHKKSAGISVLILRLSHS